MLSKEEVEKSIATDLGREWELKDGKLVKSSAHQLRIISETLDSCTRTTMYNRSFPKGVY